MPTESVPDGKPRRFSRRQLFKGAVAGVGAALAAGGLGKVVFDGLNEQEKHEKTGEAVILSKEQIPAKPTSGILIVGKSVIPTPNPGFDRWVLHVSFDGKEQKIEISREQYDKCNTGDKVKIKYDDRNMQAERAVFDENK
jgi:hypothetical protein